jgi:hypothetical protein
MNITSEFKQNSTTNLNGPIKDMKDLIRPELHHVNSKNIITLYDDMIQSHEQRKKKVEREVKKKKKYIKKASASTTILEYDFVQDPEKRKKMEHEPDELNQSMSNISKAFSLAKYNNNNFSSIYEKNMELQFLQEQKMDEIRNKKRLQEINTLQLTPTLSKESRKIIIERFSKEKPLYKRYKEVIVEKENNLDKIKDNMQEKSMTLKSTSRSSLKMNKSKSYNADEFSNWVDTNNRWIEKKNAKNDIRKKEQAEKIEKEESFPYSPVINKKSEKMVSNIRCISPNNLSSNYEKLYNDHKVMKKNIEKKGLELLPSFTPKINKNIPNYIFGVHGMKNGKSDTSLKERQQNGKSKTYIFEDRDPGLDKSALSIINFQDSPVKAKSNKQIYNALKQKSKNEELKRSFSISSSNSSTIRSSNNLLRNIQRTKSNWTKK